MLIIVEGKEIETKEITQIKDIEGKYHGFVIYLIGERSINISRSQIYETNNYERSNINDSYRALRGKVEEKWNQDKTDFIILNL